MASSQKTTRPEWVMKEVLPDLVGIDGHEFRINYDVPQHITDRLLDLLYQDPGPRYEDIPDDLKAYEVPPRAESPTTFTIKATIGGHEFEISSEAPEHIHSVYEELKMREEEVAYEDIPDELKEYEVSRIASEPSIDQPGGTKG
ncbi:hypothetical protein F4821DRAFT_203416 [Hypoxylon rubiginosum]|uniref:Uncharacterized protein n=1 Tax=Hypoxylon rubiginosum TaxID=110542 RepID=A0ACC0CRP9_9PEZI|nr:hypothetical protein F4821DRAFT_203416 [Hypoxylon rubiginosum]